MANKTINANITRQSTPRTKRPTSDADRCRVVYREQQATARLGDPPRPARRSARVHRDANGTPLHELSREPSLSAHGHIIDTLSGSGFAWSQSWLSLVSLW